MHRKFENFVSMKTFSVTSFLKPSLGCYAIVSPLSRPTWRAIGPITCENVTPSTKTEV